MFRELNAFAQLWYMIGVLMRLVVVIVRGEREMTRRTGARVLVMRVMDDPLEMVYMLMVPAMIEDSPVYVRRGRDHCLRPVESWG